MDSELVCNKNYLKTKIKSRCNEATYIYNKKNPKVGSKIILAEL